MQFIHFLLAALIFITAPAFASDHLSPTQFIQLASVHIYNPAGAMQIGGGAHAFGPYIATVAYTPRGAFVPMDQSIGYSSSIGSTNGTTLVTSYWLNVSTGSNNYFSFFNGAQMFNRSDTYCEPTSAIHPSPGICHTIDNSAGKFQVNFNDSVGYPASHGAEITGQIGNTIPQGVWTHYLFAIDTTNGVCAALQNGVDLIASGKFTCPITTGVIPDLSNAGGIHFINPNLSGGNFIAATGWISEIYVAEQNVVCRGSNNPAGHGCILANTIFPDVLPKFISASNKPVNLGPTCTLPTGVRPELCFTGDGPAMLTNRGSTSSTFSTMVVTPTTGAGYTTSAFSTLQPAPYGPAGVPSGQPTLKWITGAPGSSKISPFTVNADGHAIAPGDLIVIVQTVDDNSGTVNHGLTCPSTPIGGTGSWTAIGNGAGHGLPEQTVGGSTDTIICYAFVPAGDTTESGAYTLTWSTTPNRAASWLMMDYVNVSGIGATNSNTGLASSVTTTIKTPATTTQAAGSTMVSIFVNWNAGAFLTWSFPSGDEIRYAYGKAGSPLQQIVTEAYNVPAGTATQKIVTMSAAGGAGTGFTLELKK